MPSGQQQSAALPAPPVDVATKSSHAQSAGQTVLPATQVTMNQSYQAVWEVTAAAGTGQPSCCYCCCVDRALSLLGRVHYTPGAEHVDEPLWLPPCNHDSPDRKHHINLS